MGFLLAIRSLCVIIEGGDGSPVEGGGSDGSGTTGAKSLYKRLGLTGFDDLALTCPALEKGWASSKHAF